MISLYKDKSAVSVFWLIIICFGLHINALLHPPVAVTISPADGFFYDILKPLQNAAPYFVSLVYVLMIFLLALQLNFMLNALRMYPKQSYTAAMAFLLFSALLPAFSAVSTALFACNFFIWILYSACKLYASPNPKTSIYNFGLLCGLCIILYFASLPLILIALLALVIIRPFKLNEWFVLVFGILTPAYFLVTYLFITEKLNMLPDPGNIFKLVKLPVPPIMIMVTWAAAALIALWGINSVQGSAATVLIQVRKSWTIFLVAFFGLLPVVFFITGAYPLVLLLAMVPAAAYAGFAFAGSRNILPVIFFWVLIALSIYNNWFANY